MRENSFFNRKKSMFWEETLSKRLIKKSSLMYITLFFSAPFWYFIKMISSRSLSVEEIWLFFSVQWLVLFLWNYVDLWLTESLQYYLPKLRIEKNHNGYKSAFWNVVVIQIFLALLFWISLFFSADRLAINYFHHESANSIIKILSFYFTIFCIANINISVLFGFQRTEIVNILEMVKSGMTLSVIIILTTYWFFNTDTLAISWLIWVSIATFFWLFYVFKNYWYTLKWKFDFDKTLFREQITYATWSLVWWSTITLFSVLDQQFIMQFLWIESVWYHANFISILMMFSIIVSPILWLCYPIVTELYIKKETEKLNVFINMIIKYICVFSLFLSWIFIIFWSDLWYILFGSKFIYSWELSSYWAPFIIFNNLARIFFWILAWIWQVKQRMKVLIITLLFNIMSLYCFFWIFGMWLLWSVLSLWLTWLLMSFLSYKIVNKIITIKFDFWFFFSNLAFMTIMVWLIFYIKTSIWLELNSWYNITTQFFLLNIFYLVAMSVFNYKSFFLIWNEVKKFRNT